MHKWARGRAISALLRCSSRTWKPRSDSRLEVFDLPVMFEDDASAVFNFGNTVVNLLKSAAARELIEPAAVAGREAGSRLQLTIGVDDVDAVCAELTARGVTLLNGPMDRPWGIRTASFADPGGHIWEIAK
ncbi:MAG TPA: VOC family protein [Streptosporangiaceae bacterium]|nr:VOC family protein [Streptosporangiaceae bacterium]